LSNIFDICKINFTFGKLSLTKMRSHYLFPYWTRYLGWVCVFGHVPVMMIGRHYGLYTDSHNDALFNSNHLMFIGTALLMAVGLFLVAFSREKVEDEQIAQLRLDSLRWAIYLNYLILIVCLVFFQDRDHILLLNLWVPLLFFIIRFRWKMYQNNRLFKRDGDLQ
jgi:cell division protein FtsW (lipid II flippase)